MLPPIILMTLVDKYQDIGAPLPFHIDNPGVILFTQAFFLIIDNIEQ
jgi:hypothetical protein